VDTLPKSNNKLKLTEKLRECLGKGFEGFKELQGDAILR
jgi:hypothetical protein